MQQKRVMSRGFTLMEMLVVVLIVALLASFAIPQYRMAVVRTKMATLIPMVRALKDGMEMNYLVNGTYPDRFAGDVIMDVDMFAGCTSTNPEGWITCPDDVYFDIYGWTQLTVGAVDARHQVAYLMWLDNSAHPREKRCLANRDNDMANKLCKSLGGEVTYTENFGNMSTLGGSSNYTVYRI